MNAQDRNRRLITAILALTTGAGTAWYGVSFGVESPTTKSDAWVVTTALYCFVAGAVIGGLVGRVLSAWWVKSLRDASVFRALGLGVVAHCGTWAAIMAVMVVWVAAMLDLNIGGWHPITTLMVALMLGPYFVVIGGLVSGVAYHLLRSRETS